MKFALETATPDGIIGGDGKLHKIQIKRTDSQSDSNRAAQVAGDLIANDKVDMMMASGSPDTANPVADQCEALGCPSIANFVPWQPFIFARGGAPDKPFKWTYAHALGLEDIVGNFIAMWGQVETNKKVGFLFANDADGAAWTDMATGLPPAVKGAGYEYFLPDLYTVGTEDYTKYISDFKKNGCEICCGTVITPDFVNFWKQSVQQGYNPKVLTIGKALLFPQTLDSLGEGPFNYNMTVEGVWEPSWPYKDSITGMSCQDMADAYMAATNEQWTAPIAQYAKYRMGRGCLQARQEHRRQRRDHRRGGHHQDGHLPRPDRLHRAGGHGRPGQEPAPGQEHLQVPGGRRPVGQGHRSSGSSRSW